MLISFSSSYNSIHHKKINTIIQLKFITREITRKLEKTRSCLYCATDLLPPPPAKPPGAPRRAAVRAPAESPWTRREGRDKDEESR
jgi:hypothetical protein